jgi:hypothetical protein
VQLLHVQQAWRTVVVCARQQLSLGTPAADYATYTFNNHRIKHHFCPTCGIAPFSEASDKSGTPMAAVNARCLEGVEISALKVIRRPQPLMECCPSQEDSSCLQQHL